MCVSVWQWWCGEGHAPKKKKKKSGALCLWRQLSHPHPPPTTAAVLFQRQNDPSPLLLTLLVLPHPTPPPHLSASPCCLSPCAHLSSLLLLFLPLDDSARELRMSAVCCSFASQGGKKKRNPSSRVVCSLPSSCSQLRSLFPLSAGM